jgi:hypothetical protein
LLEPAGRLAHLTPVRHVRDACPCRAACCRRVLPRVGGFPSRCVRCSIRLPIRIRRAFPWPGLLRQPVGRFASTRQCPPRAVAGCPLVGPHRCLPPCETSRSQARRGLPSSGPSLFLPATACGLRRTCLSLPLRRVLYGLRCALTPSASATSALSTLSQHCRGHGSPCGLQETLATLRPSCSSCVRPRLRHGRKPHYGWVAGPSPTRTCTLQETPSLSWRDNARCQPLPEAGATEERTL